MENRLRGLLALMLCFILTVAPVAGAMAEANIPYISDSSDYISYAQEGDLISSGVYLGVGSGGILYHNGIYNKDMTGEKDNDYWVNETQEAATYEKDLWAAANIKSDGWPYISLERVNMIVGQIELGDNVLLIMNGLQTIDSVNKSIEDRRNALEDAAKNWEKLVFYQMGVYANVYANNTPVERVMRRVDYNGDDIEIPLPYPDQTIAENWKKYDFALFHMNSNAGVEQIECTPSDDGISFYASSFSPYALVYKLKADEGDGGEGDGGSGDGGTGDGNNDQSAVTDLPKTGDNSNLMLWIAFSVMALVGALYIARRKENA